MEKHFENIVSATQELDFVLKHFNEYIDGNKGLVKIPEIEIDLAMEKTRRIYGELQHLRKLNSEIPEVYELHLGKQLETDDPMNQNQKIVIIEPKENQEQFVQRKVELENLKPVDDSKVNEPKSKPVIPVSNDISTESLKEFKKEKQSFTDGFEKEFNYLFPEKSEIGKPDESKSNVFENNMFDKKESIIDAIFNKSKVEDFASKLQQKQISDIKEAIGLAEKMHFIDELFDKSLSLYEDSIQALNNLSSLKEALAYVNSKFNWNPEKESTLSFLEIIKRKYPV